MFSVAPRVYHSLVAVAVAWWYVFSLPPRVHHGLVGVAVTAHFEVPSSISAASFVSSRTVVGQLVPGTYQV